MTIARCLIILVFFALLCKEATAQGKEQNGPAPGSWQRNIRVAYEAGGSRHHGVVQIYFPTGYKPGASVRTLIVLHGWKQEPADWERTPIALYAEKYNIVLVCPAMRTTLYESKYYPETILRWAPIPGGEYVINVLINYLRKEYGLANERGMTGIFGISTGGRGAILLAATYPQLFGAAAALSGDYDSVSLKRDRLLVSVYGGYDKNRDRWEGEVNLLARAPGLRNTPVFLGHGGRDAVVAPVQTKMMADRILELNRKQNGFDLTYQPEKSIGAGHDWNYWAGLVPDVMDFFDKKLGK